MLQPNLVLKVHEVLQHCILISRRPNIVLYRRDRRGYMITPSSLWYPLSLYLSPSSPAHTYTCPPHLQHIPILVPLIPSTYLYLPPSSPAHTYTCPPHPQHIPILVPLIPSTYLYLPPSSPAHTYTCPPHPQHIPILVPLIPSTYLYLSPSSPAHTYTCPPHPQHIPVTCSVVVIETHRTGSTVLHTLHQS